MFIWDRKKIHHHKWGREYKKFKKPSHTSNYIAKKHFVKFTEITKNEKNVFYH